jgi:hypothetical protein
MSTDAIVTITGSVAIAAAGLLTARTEFRNKRLRRRLRIALQDCLAFHNLESNYCDRIVLLTPNAGTSSMSIRRAMRRSAREAGWVTPSGLATPQQLQQEIRCL